MKAKLKRVVSQRGTVLGRILPIIIETELSRLAHSIPTSDIPQQQKIRSRKLRDGYSALTIIHLTELLALTTPIRNSCIGVYGTTVLG